MDKSWDHPWTTQEMRKKRREWSLAGDAGLLKHLQQFSENLVVRANKTEEALDSLTTQLNETAILIDSVTNTSLALANTQFIESRVQEDDIEIQKGVENFVQESKDEDSATADLIATVSESIKQGLNIMDEKYKKMEFVDSDTEEEEEEDSRVVLSVLLGPNNPYQDRPLPYVIGSQKWKNSIKIGLESSSSSSESEQIDEEDESESDDERAALREYNMGTTAKANIGLVPSMIESEYANRNDITYMSNDKLDVVSQNNVHSASESITPNENVPKVPSFNDSAPNFAEELAKRLGTVRQAQKPVAIDEKNEASINRFKDDLFTPEGDENLNDKTKTIFSENASENSWKEKPIKSYKNNIIPASIDVPPPISTVSTKPKSSIDDLFGDADFEDSDDIFSSKNTVKTITKNKYPSNSNLANTESAQKKYLGIAAPTAASTPETNVNSDNLFSDDEDAGDLFGLPKNQLPNKKKPVGGVPILGNILTAAVESKISNRISRTQSSGSSGSNTPANNESNQEFVYDNSRNAISNDNINDRSSVAGNESTCTSGISIQPPSITTDGSSLGANFQPPMTSTQNSEFYRERVVSDSLFTARTLNQVNATSNSTPASNQPQEEQNEDSLAQQDDVFENEDLFGPPPLPKADSKSAKSKVSSLFDDSDSGDELFSTTSSGSRSQKSTDFLTAPQHPDKSKPPQRKGLFDEDIDIFGSKDAPDVDIFGIASKPAPKEDSNASRKFSGTDDNGLFGTFKSNTEKRQSTASKKISLFDDDEDMDDGDLFAVKPTKNEGKTESSIFNDDDDLFSVKKAVDEKPSSAKQPSIAGLQADNGGSDLFMIKAVDKKQDNVDPDIATQRKERKGSDILSGNGLFFSAVGSRGLVFEDDDYDDLFNNKSVTADKKGKDESTSVINTDAPGKDTDVSVDSKSFVENREPSEEVSRKMEQRDGKNTRVASEETHVIGNAENEFKKSPPKSLDIHVTTSSSQPEESGQTTRHTVSGKIKNLMGKMGDLKILSPMDTPPMWRKSEEKTDEEDSTADRDSDDGGCISTQGQSSPPSVSEDSTAQKQSTISGESNVESAISFDEPVQVETLSTASKTRVRIQVKRRPQSRHARKSALIHSGIDFDTVDSGDSHLQNESRGEHSSIILSKESTNSMNVHSAHTVTVNPDRLAPFSANDGIHRPSDVNLSLAADDKSELGSISKESSMSANKNTLLSPSTDEEDLFDVPPDLPEDPQKEDTLFGRAPILSPVERVLEKPPVSFKPLKDTHIKRLDSVDTEKDTTTGKSSKIDTLTEHQNDSITETVASIARKKDDKRDSVESKDESKEVMDPLRDSSHDPLKDPSSLFAFVTKTPSPEKGKNLLFSEDDSLFASGTKKPSEEQTVKKPVLDLFADDTEGDLFSSSLSKPVKKPLKDTKISLFDDDDQDDESDSLFGHIAKKSSGKAESGRKNSVQQPRKRASLFDDDDDDANLFSEHSEHSQKSDSGSIREQSSKTEIFASVTEPVKTSHITDIFADQSSGEDDIFASKIIPKKIVKSKSLFPSDDDDDDDNSNIFGKKSSVSESQVKPTEARSTSKKSVTRDLKKVAEKIGEDPLSILQDD
ncbi:PWP1 homolog no child left behind [Calliopsis andreniformis]|uniref:PWP1 homolog no child left behind n=1 Tax=Calliopsis andreniformis TaxID=337506 RepID=UPI003FCD29C0